MIIEDYSSLIVLNYYFFFNFVLRIDLMKFSGSEYKLINVLLIILAVTTEYIFC